MIGAALPRPEDSEAGGGRPEAGERMWNALPSTRWLGWLVVAGLAEAGLAVWSQGRLDPAAWGKPLHLNPRGQRPQLHRATPAWRQTSESSGLDRAPHPREGRLEFPRPLVTHTYGYCMKTTVMIDDAVFQQARVHAARQGRSLSAVLTESLRAYLRTGSDRAGPAPALQIPVYGGSSGRGSPGATPAELAALRDDGR
jgi:plasmid stability protein